MNNVFKDVVSNDTMKFVLMAFDEGTGLTIINHTSGSATITPVYPSIGTSVNAITIFPIISNELETSGVICSPSPCMAFLTTHMTAVT